MQGKAFYNDMLVILLLLLSKLYIGPSTGPSTPKKRKEDGKS